MQSSNIDNAFFAQSPSLSVSSPSARLTISIVSLYIVVYLYSTSIQTCRALLKYLPFPLLNTLTIHMYSSMSRIQWNAQSLLSSTTSLATMHTYMYNVYVCVGCWNDVCWRLYVCLYVLTNSVCIDKLKNQYLSRRWCACVGGGIHGIKILLVRLTIINNHLLWSATCYKVHEQKSTKKYFIVVLRIPSWIAKY